MRILAFNGMARTGKDTIAKRLVKHGWHKLDTVQVIKNMVATLIGAPVFEDYMKEENASALGRNTYRDVLIDLCKTVEKYSGDEVWNILAVNHAKKNNLEKIIMTNLYKESGLSWLRSTDHDFKMVYLHRENNNSTCSARQDLSSYADLTIDTTQQDWLQYERDCLNLFETEN